MGKTVIEINTTDDVPEEVLVEHVRWAVGAFTSESGDTTVELYNESRQHPFDGPEVFDDYNGKAENKPSLGGYLPDPPKLVYDPSFDGPVIPMTEVSAAGRENLSILNKALQAMKDRRGKV